MAINVSLIASTEPNLGPLGWQEIVEDAVAERVTEDF